MSASGFTKLLDAVRDLVLETPALRDFAPWPDSPEFVDVPPLAIPAIRLIQQLEARTTEASRPVAEAVAAVAHAAHWQQTYSEAEVGRDFLNRYGWFELLGPSGHFRSDRVRAYIAYWGEALRYPVHLHQAEELYYVLAGAAEFHAQGQPSDLVTPGGTRHHASNQPHAMDTHAEPVLTLVLWRGPGLTGSARMGTS